MYKKLLSIFLCLLSVLFINNPAFAIEKSKTVIIDNYKPELSSFINISESNEPIYIVRERTIRNTSNEMSWAWIGSIFMPGLGQILLGDITRGLIFIAITGISIYISTAFNLVLFLLGIPVILTIYIWSIVDAYILAADKAKNGYETKNIEKQLADLENSINKISIENNQLKYSLVNF